MEQFTKPENLNGGELRDELRAAGVKIGDKFDAVMVDDMNILLLDIASADKVKANAVVAAHNGTVADREATIEEKLASVGLSVTDLKTALGL
jgi:hypothetical protein